MSEVILGFLDLFACWCLIFYRAGNPALEDVLFSSREVRKDLRCEIKGLRDYGLRCMRYFR